MSTPVAPLRTLRVAAAYLVRGVARGGCERVEERGARVRARGKSVYISSLVQKRPKTARAPRARALASLNTHTANQRCGQPRSLRVSLIKRGTAANLYTAHRENATHPEYACRASLNRTRIFWLSLSVKIKRGEISGRDGWRTHPRDSACERD